MLDIKNTRIDYIHVEWLRMMSLEGFVCTCTMGVFGTSLLTLRYKCRRTGLKMTCQTLSLVYKNVI